MTTTTTTPAGATTITQHNADGSTAPTFYEYDAFGNKSEHRNGFALGVTGVFLAER